MTRAERNNNPLNIRRGSPWKGLAVVQPDNEFCSFISIVYGYRAAWYLIKKYINTYQVDTPAKIIHRWCPDNTAQRYTDYVCKKAGLDPDGRLTWTSDKDKIADILLAMSRYEGYTMKLDDVLKTYIQKGLTIL